MAELTSVLGRIEGKSLPTKPDVVVIGGGIIGLSIALEIVEMGMSVSILERSKVGSAQSTRNWGFVRQQGRSIEELPLMIEANQMWRDLEARLDYDLEWAEGGNLRLTDDSARAENYLNWIDTAKSFGLDSRTASPEEVSRIIPGFTGRYLMAILTPSDGQANPTKVVGAYLRQLLSRGVEIYEDCFVSEIVTEAGRVVGVRTADTLIATSNVVVAAGVGSASLLRKLGLAVPVQYVSQTVALTGAVPPITQACVWTGQVGFRQARSGSIVLSTGGHGEITIDSGTIKNLVSPSYLKQAVPMYWKNREYLKVRPRESLRSLLRGNQHLKNNHGAVSYTDVVSSLKTMEGYFPKLNWDILLAWSGVIDATPDALPIIDANLQPSGLIIATGMSGHGFGIAPAIGKAVAELVTNGSSKHDLSAFCLGRFRDGTAKTPHHLL